MSSTNCETCGLTPEGFEINRCPECGSEMKMMEGCSMCMSCGHSPCK